MTKIGKYELLESLGKGSYGEVYRARNPLGVVVALKLLRRELMASPKAVEDFQREAALAMTLNHANIVQVLDYDEAEGVYFIVMRYLEGQRLDEALQEGKPLDQKKALAVLSDLAAGLDYAHGEGVLHRDLKPKNVILLKKDGRAVMLDFGLARELEGGSAEAYTGDDLTRLGRGTAGYMAPEQIQRNMTLTAQTDLYALGVVAYRLLVGRLPFEGDEFSVLEGHVRMPPPEAHQVNAKLPQAVSAVLNQALAKKPPERFASGTALVAALVEALKPQPAPAPRVEVVSPPRPAAQPQTRMREKDGMVEVYIGAGEFWMGSADSDKDARADEKPQHRVYLDGYWMDQTPVTNAMFARFVAQTSHRTLAEKKGYGYVYNTSKKQWEQTQGADWRHPTGAGSTIRLLEGHPVLQVSWEDALAYCDWVGARLPSEAQWEKAARGVDGRKYPWGNQEADATLANFNRNIGSNTPVGSYPGGASPYGLLDMAGNVWEWCADWYGETYYKVSPPRNPTGPASGSYRVLRGGSWLDVSWSIRAAFRNRGGPAYSDGNYGFRCARCEALP